MSLEKALQAFLAKVEAVMPSSRKEAAGSSHSADISKLGLKDLYNLRMLVEDLESKSEFKTLVKETGHSFSKNRDYAGFWSLNVEAFLRRTGFYLSSYTGKTPDSGGLLRKYSEAFAEKTTLIRHLVPLEFVGFDEDLIAFGRFRVVRLGRKDLEALLQSEINHVFYPYAYADVSTLTDIWFLEVTETVEVWEPGSGGPAGLHGPELDIKFTDFPLAVEYALKHLALNDWGTYQAPFRSTQKSKLIKELETGWDRFHIPFVISTHDNPLWSPNAMPNLTVLATQPDFDDEGEQCGERPVVEMVIENPQFKTTMDRIAELMTASESERSGEWHFLEIALGYLTKAFFADGLDQLLWHLVTLEALLGDDEPGLTKRLGNRIAFVAADDDKENLRIRKLITSKGDDGLYQLRSDIVHGNAALAKKGVHLGHLREARELARKCVLWFLESLSQLRQTKQPLELASRAEVLASIDVLSNSKLNTRRVQCLIELKQPISS